MIDTVTGLRFTNKYTYHHGYYDHEEREFRGFGMVEQVDTEEYEYLKKVRASNATNIQFHEFPVLTKTWFHTGAYLRNKKSNVGVKVHNQFVWFRKWIMERQVYKYLVRDSGLSQSSIQRLFHPYLKSAPQTVIKSKRNVHLIIDGTYFTNGLCLILYYDYDTQYVQFFRETNQEKFKEIKEDLLNLKKWYTSAYYFGPGESKRS